ncbi:hypothetical protein RI367_007294 [Sorochytrium milnesiophthora]
MAVSAVLSDIIRQRQALTFGHGADILQFALTTSSHDYVWYRARHVLYGDVLVKCAQQGADHTVVARLRWEYFVTRDLDVQAVVVPLTALRGFEASPFALVFPAFHNPLRGVSAMSRSRTVSNTSSDGKKFLSAGDLRGAQTLAVPQRRQPSCELGIVLPLDHNRRQMTLGAYVQSFGLLNLHQSAILLSRAAQTLKLLHDRGILFCNLSFDTILLEFPRYSLSAAEAPDWSSVLVKLCDFSHASKLPGEVISHSTVDFVLHGDIRFMSPESTGRMNRHVDLRTDLYSLGMVIHGALTGTTPPESMSMLNALHYHVAVLPIPLQQHFSQTSSAPTTDTEKSQLAGFQHIIDHLVAKLPEDRYPSCETLLGDAHRFLHAHETSDEFVPGHRASRTSILADTQLYGRSCEIAQARTFQQQVYSSDSGGVLVVAGISGGKVGKTSLVQELVLPAFNMGGIYAAGKFDQYKREVPFVPFIQAFTDIINILLLESPDKLEALVGTLHEKLHDSISLLSSLIPNVAHLMQLGHSGGQRHSASEPAGLGLIIQPPTPPSPVMSQPNLSAPEMLTRTHQTFTTFLNIVSSYKPLTIVIDDVQWADWSTSRYILHLINERLPHHVLLVLTYRSEEIAENQHLRDLSSQLVAYAQDGAIMLDEIHLGNLNAASIELMLGQLSNSDTAAPHGRLVDLVIEKTLGNPYYVKRFLQRLIDYGALQPSETPSDGWSWDLDKVRAAVPMDNVLDMLGQQLQTMNGATRMFLEIGSVLGVDFRMADLADLLQTTDATAWQAMLPAVTEGYVRITRRDSQPLANVDPTALNLPFADLHAFATAEDADAHGRRLQLLDGVTVSCSDSSFQLTSTGLTSDTAKVNVFACNGTLHDDEPEAQVQYQWEHDRVQQATYQLIDETLRPLVHLKVGLWQLQSNSADAVNDIIFDLIHHLSFAKHLLTDRQDKRNLARLYAVAASKAKRSAAMDLALTYSQDAISLLDDDMWADDYDFCFHAHFMVLLNAAGNGHHAKMKTQIDLLRAHTAANAYLRGMVYEQEIIYYSAQGDWNRSVTCGLEALQLFHCALSSDAQHVQALYTEANCSPQEIAALVDKPQMTDMEVHSALRVMINMLPSVYGARADLMPGLVLTMVHLSRTRGNSDYGAYAYTLCGLLMSSLYDNAPLAYEYGKLGMALIKQYPASPLNCHVHNVFASHILPWMDTLQRSLDCFEVANAYGKAWQNSEYTSYGIVELLGYKLLGGFNLTSLKGEVKLLNAELEAFNFPVAIDYGRAVLAVPAHLNRRKFCAVMDLLTPEEHMSLQTAKATIVPFTYWVSRLMLHFLANEFGSARLACDQLDLLRNGHLGSLFNSEYILFKGLLAVRQYMVTNDKTAQATLLEELEYCVQRYTMWAANCPSTFACRLRLLQGCAAWLCSDMAGGLNHLDAAIELAQLHGFPNIEAIANETAGQLWLYCKKWHLANVYMDAAHRAYRAWGAEWKANQVYHHEQSSGRSLSQDSPTTPTTQVSEDTTVMGSMADEVDVEMLCHWTIALASERTQDSLLEQFLRLAMLYTGSREGLMLWTTSDKREVLMVDDMKICVHSMVDDGAKLHTTLQPTDMRPPMIPAANYAIRTKETISESSTVMATFLKGGQVTPPRGSFLFFPIVHHGVCVGLLYLANELSHKTFLNTKRSSLLKLLSSQLNISFENMRLLEELRAYNEALQEQTATLEVMVSQRTSELEKANQQLSNEVVERKKAEGVAVQAAAANRSFLHNMSHELRTPLNCIIGMTELLSQTELSKEQVDILDPVMLSAADLLQIINDILDLSKIESGKLTISKHAFSLREVVDNSLDTISGMALKKRITLAALYPLTIPTMLHSDSTRIGQVLRNLLSNAIKFTHEGEITLEILASPTESTSPDEKNVHQFTIKCTDTGIGLSPEQMTRLFKAFSQADHSTTRKFGGTGLGLNISKGFANLLQGDLVCTSEPDKGSTFMFTFKSEVLEDEVPIASRLPSNVTFVLCLSKPILRTMIRGYLDANAPKFIDVAEGEALREYQGEGKTHPNTVFVVDEQAGDNVAEVQAPKVILSHNDKANGLVKPNDALATHIRYPVRSSRLHDAIVVYFLNEQSKSAAPAPKKHALKPQFSLRVLLAEDNPVNRAVAERMLQKFGIRIDVAVDGKQALDACERNVYDLVLMDVMMPVMDGHDSTRAIRKSLPTHHQPLIIALTANAFVEDKIVCLNAGMNDVLTKPLTLSSLEGTLLKHFQPVQR